MRLGKVLGTVVASQKQGKLDGLKLLIVQDMDHEGRLLESTRVAADTAGAGVGEVVLCTSGSSSRYTSPTHEAPVDDIIVGVVDAIDLGSRRVYDKQQAT
jgi:ethanolamine utilization protein EutN